MANNSDSELEELRAADPVYAKIIDRLQLTNEQVNEFDIRYSMMLEKMKQQILETSDDQMPLKYHIRQRDAPLAATLLSSGKKRSQIQYGLLKGDLYVKAPSGGAKKRKTHRKRKTSKK